MLSNLHGCVRVLQKTIIYEIYLKWVKTEYIYIPLSPKSDGKLCFSTSHRYEANRAAEKPKSMVTTN
jgi:hypothetical protein